MKLDMEILQFDRPYETSDVEQSINNLLEYRGANGWRLVSTARQWFGDAVEVWLYFEIAGSDA